MSIRERLLKHVKIVDGHWLWTSSLSWNGYGLIRIGKKFRKAHIVSYEEFVGPVPPGKCVLHARICVEHRECICPDHLYPGNRGDNSADCFTTGGRGRSSLSDTDIIEIRTSSDQYAVIGQKFNISAQAVSQIKHGHTWAELTKDTPAVISDFARTPGGNIGGRGSSKLSNQDVLDIRASNLPRKELALAYGITKESITHIRKRHTFKNL